MIEVKKPSVRFLNRLDEIIVFHELNEEQLRQVVDLLAKDLPETSGRTQIKRGKSLKRPNHGWQKKGMTGVRAVRCAAALEKYVENPLAVKVLGGEFKEGDTIVVGYRR